MNRKFDFSDAWTAMIAMFRAHADLVLAVAGVFVFLPVALMAILVPFSLPEGTQPQAMWPLIMAHFEANWYWYLLSQIIQTIGMLAILALLLKSAGISVAQAITLGATAMPAYVLANLITTIPYMLGMILLFLPFLYLLVKFSMTGPVLIAEGVRNPITALGRSWRITKGNSIMLFLFGLIIFLVCVVIMMAVSAVIGIALSLALPADIAKIANDFISALVNGLFLVVVLVTQAAVYRQLAVPAEEQAEVPLI